MNVLQTIDLKKYYGSTPNITRALITKPGIIPAVLYGLRMAGVGEKEVADHDMAF